MYTFHFSVYAALPLHPDGPPSHSRYPLLPPTSIFQNFPVHITRCRSLEAVIAALEDTAVAYTTICAAPLEIGGRPEEGGVGITCVDRADDEGSLLFSVLVCVR